MGGKHNFNFRLLLEKKVAFNLCLFDICTVCPTTVQPHLCIYFVLEWKENIGSHSCGISIQTNMKHSRIIYDKNVFHVVTQGYVFVKCTEIYSSVVWLIVVIFFSSQEFYFLVSLNGS